jgi:hypothetical protein
MNEPAMERHKTVTVRVGPWEAAMDELIAPLIEELWKAGIETTNSCQENQPGITWIAFATAADAVEFLNIVAEYEEELDILYNRMCHDWDRESAPLSAPYWEYEVHPVDLALCRVLDPVEEAIDEWHTGCPDFGFTLSIRFPLCDLPVLTARMQHYNRAQGLCDHDPLARCPSASLAGPVLVP